MSLTTDEKKEAILVSRAVVDALAKLICMIQPKTESDEDMNYCIAVVKRLGDFALEEARFVIRLQDEIDGKESRLN